MTQPAPVMSVAEAARTLQVGRDTILRMIWRGELSAEKFPGRTGAYVIPRQDVEALSERRSA